MEYKKIAWSKKRHFLYVYGLQKRKIPTCLCALSQWHSLYLYQSGRRFSISSPSTINYYLEDESETCTQNSKWIMTGLILDSTFQLVFVL